MPKRSTKSKKSNTLLTNKELKQVLRIRLPENYEATSNKVNHPAHYGGKDNPYEAILFREISLSDFDPH